MKRTHWKTLFFLILALALSTACLTLFPTPAPPTPTEFWHEPERGPLKFDPSEGRLPSAKVGAPYEVQIKISQNVTPVGNFKVDPKTLPPGLELVFVKSVRDIAKITGTPTQAGTYTFHIDVWCYGTMVPGQTGSQEYTIVVE